MLEIGTGCGYQTAVLAQIAGEVYSVERIGALVAKARRNLQSLKVRNVRLKHGDGSTDLGEDLSVDAIVVTAAATHVPQALLKYLKPGGRMVLPLAQRDALGEGVQRLTVLARHAGRRLSGTDARCGKIRAVAFRSRVTPGAPHALQSPITLPPLATTAYSAASFRRLAAAALVAAARRLRDARSGARRRALARAPTPAPVEAARTPVAPPAPPRRSPTGGRRRTR